MITSLEKIPVKLFNGSYQGSVLGAQIIANLIKEKEADGKKCIIGWRKALHPNSYNTDIAFKNSDNGVG